MRPRAYCESGYKEARSSSERTVKQKVLATSSYGTSEDEVDRASKNDLEYYAITNLELLGE